MDNKLSIYLKRFLILQLEIPVCRENDIPDFTACFQEEHCFLPHIQSQLTANTFSWLLSAVKEHIFYEILDLLGIRLLLFKYANDLFIVGPYVEDHWNDISSQETLTHLKLPASYILPYKSYYCNYSVVSTQQILHTAFAAMRALTPDMQEYKYQPVHGITDEKDLKYLHRKVPDDIQQIQKRYQLENELLHMVKEGKAYPAITAWKKLSSSSNNNYPVLQYYDKASGYNILRTLVRKAAESAGVNPVIIDSIAQAHAQKIYSHPYAKPNSSLTQDMILEFCDAVKKIKSDHYSLPVRKAVDYIIIHLSMPMSLAEIAKASGITASRLSHIFKNETGYSVINYVAKRRCDIAANLLKASSLSISDISLHVGYADNNYFVKVFKAHYNMTPSTYRKEYRKL